MHPVAPNGPLHIKFGQNMSWSCIRTFIIISRLGIWVELKSLYPSVLNGRILCSQVNVFLNKESNLLDIAPLDLLSFDSEIKKFRHQDEKIQISIRCLQIKSLVDC